MGLVPIHLAVVAVGDAWEDLRILLTSLDTQRAAYPLRVTIGHHVDDHRPFESLKRAFPWVLYTELEENVGYGSAINRLIREYGSDNDGWLVACNADLVFPLGSVEAMVAAATEAERDVGLIAPRLLDDRDTQHRPVTQPSVGRFPSLRRLLTGRARARRWRKYVPTPRRSADIDWATGACLMIRRRAFDDLAGFDESIFLDYEDTDLCRRLADAGWRRRCQPEWMVIHTGPNAQRPPSPTRHEHTRASLVRYFAKHRPAWELHALGLLLRATVIVRSQRHPFAAGWRSGLDTYLSMRRRSAGS